LNPESAIGALVEAVISERVVPGLDRNPTGMLSHDSFESIANRLLDLGFFERKKGPARMKAVGPNGRLIRRQL
jgi:hypothetical protein